MQLKIKNNNNDNNNKRIAEYAQGLSQLCCRGPVLARTFNYFSLSDPNINSLWTGMEVTGIKT